MNYFTKIVIAIVLVLLVGVLYAQYRQEDVSEDIFLSSVRSTDEYQSTSTAPNSTHGAQTATIFLLKTGQGSLGSVVILGAAQGVMSFYDATTSNVDDRLVSGGTSTILITSLPENAAVGTYVFDIEFTTGLLYVLEAASSTTTPTSTITFR